MPELPEVETIVIDLRAAGIVGRALSCARVYWPRSIALPTPEDFCRRIAGRRIAAVRRRGKFIVFDLHAGGSLLIHLRMSGRLHLVPAETARQPHEHVILTFDDGTELRFHDTRKFGRLYFTPDALTVLDRLGPEPLERGFTPRVLLQGLRRHRRRIKPLLLDQGFIAGLGNIYTDEALWEAKIHPQRRSDSLSPQEADALCRAIRRVLKRGLKNLGTTLGTGRANFYSVSRRPGRNREELNVFRRTGRPCPRCGRLIERILVGQRSTHVCPKCQKTGSEGSRGQGVK